LGVGAAHNTHVVHLHEGLERGEVRADCGQLVRFGHAQRSGLDVAAERAMGEGMSKKLPPEGWIRALLSLGEPAEVVVEAAQEHGLGEHANQVMVVVHHRHSAQETALTLMAQWKGVDNAEPVDGLIELAEEVDQVLHAHVLVDLV
jgi:hypothetical protein